VAEEMKGRNRKRGRYTPEFKQEAVRLVESGQRESPVTLFGRERE
jgi:transposase-like protein